MDIAVLGSGRLADRILKTVMTEYYSWVITIGPDGSQLEKNEQPKLVQITG